VYRFTPEEMLSRYERGWRYYNVFDNLDGEELNFLKEIAKCYESWLVAYLSLYLGLSNTQRAFEEVQGSHELKDCF
jgi:hypothetical protein